MTTHRSTKYPSCPNCAAQFPAPPKGKKFDPICTNCGFELRLRCDYCGTQYTPKRWVFTTENREGNQFCCPAHKKRARAEQLSKAKAKLRAELFKPRQCARKGAPTARENKYRIDCPVVFTPVRVKDIFCSDECKDMARYYNDPEPKRTYATARYAADPVKFRARGKKYRRRKIRRLGVNVVRALERTRYPIKKARREARRAAELERLAKLEADVLAAKADVVAAEAEVDRLARTAETTAEELAQAKAELEAVKMKQAKLEAEIAAEKNKPKISEKPALAFMEEVLLESPGYLSNKDIAIRCRDEDMPCPYAETWDVLLDEGASSNDAYMKAVGRLRKKLGKPGRTRRRRKARNLAA